MKQRLYYRLVLLFLLSISLFQCKKDDDSGPFIDGYEPKLTDVKGTAYVGDFFPADEGYTWTYDNDTVYLNGNLTFTYGGHTESVSLLSVTDYHEIITKASKSMKLGGSDIIVFPSVEDSITQYIQIADTSANIPFYSYGDSTFKLNHPFYIKKTLVAGDKWEADPILNFDKYLEYAFGNIVQDFGYSVGKSYIYVFGKDTIMWRRNVNDVLTTSKIMTVKVEQRSSVTGHATLLLDDTIPGVLNYSAEYISNMNLADTVGIVKSVNSIKISGKGHYLIGDEKVYIGMNYTLTLKSILNKDGLVKNTSTQSNVYPETYSKSNPKSLANQTIYGILKRHSQFKDQNN